MNNELNVMIDERLIRMELAEIRKSTHMTQAQVAEKSGLSRSTVSKIESGEMESVRLTNLIKYADAIDCTLFVNMKDKKSKEDNKNEEM